MSSCFSHPQLLSSFPNFLIILCHFHSFFLQPISKLFSKWHLLTMPNSFSLLKDYCNNAYYQYFLSLNFSLFPAQGGKSYFQNHEQQSLYSLPLWLPHRYRFLRTPALSLLKSCGLNFSTFPAKRATEKGYWRAPSNPGSLSIDRMKWHYK